MRREVLVGDEKMPHTKSALTNQALPRRLPARSSSTSIHWRWIDVGLLGRVPQLSFRLRRCLLYPKVPYLRSRGSVQPTPLPLVHHIHSSYRQDVLVGSGRVLFTKLCSSLNLKRCISVLGVSGEWIPLLAKVKYLV